MPHKDSGKAGDTKTRLPPLYKKRIWQAILLYLLLMGAAGYWIHKNTDKTVHDWNARTPQAIVALTGAGLIPEAETPPETVSTTQGTGLVLPSGTTADIAIILTDAGLSESATQKAMQTLPKDVAMAFSPYSMRLAPWIDQAKTAGRETLLLLPMEPLTYPKDDPGPQALLSRKSETSNIETLQSLLALGKTDGVMNFMGSRFLGDRRNMVPALAKIRQSGLMFVENPSMSGLQSAATFAQETNVPYLSADVHIDAQATPALIRQQLFQLEKIAQEKGYAIGIASPYPVTLDIIPQWADSLKSRGFKLAPPSTLVDKQASQKPKAP